MNHTKNWDEQDYVDAAEKLSEEIATLEARLNSKGKTFDARPVTLKQVALNEDVIHTFELLQGHKAKLDVLLRISGAATAAPKPISPPVPTTAELSRSSAFNSPAGNSFPIMSTKTTPNKPAAKLNATEALLASKGARNLEHLAEIRKAERSEERRKRLGR